VKPRRLFTHGVEAVALVPPADTRGAADFLAGLFVGACKPDFAVELHEANGRPLPSFTVTVGPHVLIVHVDEAIA